MTRIWCPAPVCFRCSRRPAGVYLARLVDSTLTLKDPGRVNAHLKVPALVAGA